MEEKQGKSRFDNRFWNAIFVTVDVSMIVLLILNLTFLIFDLIFQSASVQDFLSYSLPNFYNWYAVSVHPDFLAYDLIFIAIFAIELLGRWIVSIYQKTYPRWFFFPFVHWYDVLGLIPFGSFRLFRFLRIFSVLNRMKKMEIWNYQETYFFKQLRKYYFVVVEEVADRVVINVLDSVKEEVRSGSPIADEVVTQIIVPHKEELVQLLSDRIQLATENVYKTRKPEIEEYVRASVQEAMTDNKELKRMATYIPIGGKIIADMIRSATQDIVFNVINGMANDLASADNKEFVDEIADIAIEVALMRTDEIPMEEEDKEDVLKKIILSSLDLVKDRVAIQQWKVREKKEKKAYEHAKRQAELEEALRREVN